MGLYKRGGTWWFSLTHNGKRIQKSTEVTDKRLAERIYGKILNEVEEGKYFDKPTGENKTIGELLDRYLEEHSEANKAPNVSRTDKSMVKELKAFFGDRKLSEITPSLIANYKSFCRKKGLAPSTINSHRFLLRHAFKFAIQEWEWCQVNPVDKVSRDKVKNERDRWLTIEEEGRLLEHCVLYPTLKDNKTEPRYWLQEVVIFALNTGMRQDEILSLEWPNVDLFRKTLTVVKSKNGEKRTIPLNQKVFELLKSKAKVRSIKGNYVFINEAGNKIVDSNLRRGFYKALERAKIEDFRFHDLRHTFATRLAQAGVDIYKIAKLLGHKDIKMTQRYSHHYPESLRDGVEVLDSICYKIATVNEKGATQNA